LTEYFIVGSAIVSIIFGLINAAMILKIEIVNRDDEIMALKEEKHVLQYRKMQEIADLIEKGAQTFLWQEYVPVSVFVVIFSLLIGTTVEKEAGQFYTVLPFVLGAITSIISGYIGMAIAVKANVRTCKEATFSLHRGFVVAFRGGLVLGFTLVGLALLVLMGIIMVYERAFLGTVRDFNLKEMFEAIAGYGLGGSLIALFGRVGGGIYTKAADVGSDLAGKVVAGLPEDSPLNPGVIADNVGDNVGDIAGMGSDLFGSFAESTCACLIISATSKELV
jgi:inorganic pyrophosphatase